MIVSKIRVISERDTEKFAWSALSNFHNVSFGQEAISQAHNLQKSQASNSKKQAEQLRFCLLQAREYFKAARTVTSASKPTLLYYGVMSLALAQMLLAGDGEYSLDFARGQHAHHGLDFRMNGAPSASLAIEQSASSLRAVPLLKKGNERFGTFELWHRISRESPMAGKQNSHLANGAGTQETIAIAVGRDERMPLVPEQGHSLLHCFQYVPAMRDLLFSKGVPTGLGRGVIVLDHHEVSKTICSQFIIHPGEGQLQRKVYDGFIYEPRAYEELEIIEVPRGCIIMQRWADDSRPASVSYPNSFQHQESEIFFCSDNAALNEFGILYFGIFILGNYARYYPDYWMRDVELSSALAVSSERFMDIVEARAPLLTASVLDRVYYLTNSA